MVVVETRAEIGFRIPLIVLVGPESEFRAPHLSTLGPESEFRTPHPHPLRPESLIRTLKTCEWMYFILIKQWKKPNIYCCFGRYVNWAILCFALVSIYNYRRIGFITVGRGYRIFTTLEII